MFARMRITSKVVGSFGLVFVLALVLAVESHVHTATLSGIIRTTGIASCPGRTPSGRSPGRDGRPRQPWTGGESRREGRGARGCREARQGRGRAHRQARSGVCGAPARPEGRPALAGVRCGLGRMAARLRCAPGAARTTAAGRRGPVASDDEVLQAYLALVASSAPVQDVVNKLHRPDGGGRGRAPRRVGPGDARHRGRFVGRGVRDCTAPRGDDHPPRPLDLRASSGSAGGGEQAGGGSRGRPVWRSEATSLRSAPSSSRSCAA